MFPSSTDWQVGFVVAFVLYLLQSVFSIDIPCIFIQAVTRALTKHLCNFFKSMYPCRSWAIKLYAVCTVTASMAFFFHHLFLFHFDNEILMCMCMTRKKTKHIQWFSIRYFSDGFARLLGFGCRDHFFILSPGVKMLGKCPERAHYRTIKYLHSVFSIHMDGQTHQTK